VTEFTQALPKGLLTTVGPGGVQLSGGQQQRIALARALLNDAPILILDEPTAMFDPQSEDELTKQLKESLKGRTTIIVTHRAAILQIADKVIDFDLAQECRTEDTKHAQAPQLFNSNASN